jgi:hypothetical protein
MTCAVVVLSVDVILGPPTTDNIFGSNKAAVFITPSLLLGLGEGADLSGGLIGVYDMADIADYGGVTAGIQGAAIPGAGGQAAWNFGVSPGVNGKQTQTWHFGGGGGGELSLSGSIGYSFEFMEWDRNNVAVFPRTPVEINIPISHKSRYYPY